MNKIIKTDIIAKDIVMLNLIFIFLNIISASTAYFGFIITCHILIVNRFKEKVVVSSCRFVNDVLQKFSKNFTVI